jgi:Dolichyl-phosphate-mannose-protein mannosyltransferase
MRTRDALPPPTDAVRPPRGAWAALLGYALVIWWLFGDQPIGGSWREADTQSMARNLVHDGFDLLHPRVDWRGATDGRVEAEFPLYQALVGVALQCFGDVEWPGRLLSLLSLLATASALFALAARPCGAWPAALGVAAFLSGPQAALLGTRVIPDGLSTALAMSGLALLVSYLRTDRPRLLLWATLLTTLGLLSKPTAVVIVLMQVALVLAGPQRRRAAVWLAFATMAAALAAWTLHARANGLATGLTFGVTFGDTKLPDVDHLLRPGLYASLARTTAGHGLGWFGIAAGLALLLQRRPRAVDFVVLTAVTAGLLVSLRYSHSEHAGAHYHVFAALAGGWLVARVLPAAPAPWLVVVMAVALLAQAVTSLHGELEWRQRNDRGADLATGAALRELTGERDLVVIRGPKPGFDALWRRPNNFEEPVLLYQSRRKGWVLPVDGVEPEMLRRLSAQGARWYVETAPEASPALQQWLDDHCEQIPIHGRARLFRMAPE